MAAPPNDLIAAIKGATSDVQLQEGLLYGAWGESGWYDNPNSGYFGFTSSVYGGAAQESAQQQVAAILGPGTYQNAESQLPPGVTGVSAAEFIALGGEAPVFSTVADLGAYPLSVQGNTEYQLGYSYTPGVSIPAGGISQQQVIAETGQPTQYGANKSIDNTATWNDIVSALGAPNVSTGSGSGTSGNGTGEQTGPPSKSGTSGQRETNADAVALAKQNQATLFPTGNRNADPNNPRGFVYTLNSLMNPKYQNAGTDKQGNKRTFWSGVEDVLTGKAELEVLGNITGTSGTVGAIIHDAEIVANPQNLVLGITSWLVRLAVFFVGVVVVFIAVNALTHGSLLSAFSKVPIPI